MSTANDESTPPFPVERPAHRPWREGAVTRANELETLRRWLDRGPDAGRTTELSAAVRRHLEIARETASEDRSRWRSMTGASLQRTASNLDAAEATLLRLAPNAYLEGQLPALLTQVRRYLSVQDARRVQLEVLVARRQAERRSQDVPAPQGPDGRRASVRVRPFTDEERGVIVAAVRAASSEEVRVLMQAQSFRNTLAVTAMTLILLAATAAVLSIASPATVPLCFAPQSGDRVTAVCPTAQRAVPSVGAATTGATPPEAVDRTIRRTAGRWDLLTVEALGLAAAAISAAVALRKVPGSSTPLGIPIALAILKLPLGALIAVLGILLMRGQFVPGLSALDSSAQILAWAVVFGYAQQTFTRFIDRQANTVLDNVKRQPSTEVPAEATEAAAASPPRPLDAATDAGDGGAGSPVNR